MSAKTEYYAKVASDASRDLTGSVQNWTGFLTTVGRLYRYSFPDQLMIYAQRPDATACAEYDLWNDTMHRYVKRGAKGIGLFDRSGDQPRIRYVFDVSDTGERRNSRPVRLWTIQEGYEEPVRDAFAEACGVQREETLVGTVRAAAQIRASDYWDRYSDRILDILDGSLLADYDEDGIRKVFLDAAVPSITYAAAVRCSDDADALFETEDFEGIFDFNTRQAANALGTAVSDVSREIFREIEIAIRDYERSLAEVQRANVERGADDGRTELRAERGLPDPGHAADRGRSEGAGQVRQDAEGISRGERPDPPERPDPDRETVPAPVGDPGDGGEKDGAADGGAPSEGPGTGQSQGPDGLGQAYEQPPGTGRGDRDSGTYQQLTLDLFPAEKEQIERIDEAVESEELSTFFIDDEEIEHVLASGSGFAGGKRRIAVLFEKEGNPKARADYLKEEYGTGGRSHTFLDGSRGFVDYSSRGMLIRRYGYDIEKRLHWRQVERHLQEMIDEERYLTQPEKDDLAALEAEYLDVGGIPLPEPGHTFPSPERIRERMANEAGREAGQPEEILQREGGEEQDGSAGEGVNEEDILQQEADVKQNEAPAGTENEEEVLQREDDEEQDEPETGPVNEEDSPQEHAVDEVPIQEASTKETVPAVNFRITDDHLGEGGPKEKFARNIEAIELLMRLEEEDRNALPEEQEILSRYVGWGGLPEAFDPDNAGWTKEYARLRALLPEREYEMARASTLNAHYTSPTVIRAIYDAVGRMGFTSGNILEPSMGIGNFFGMLPEEMRESRLYGVELDSVSGRIAQKLYPDAEITVAGFETTDRRDFYDLAVGNVPFGSYRVSDKPYDKLGFSIHNYFFAKALDQVRPGGVVAFVTSRYTMDAKTPTARKYLAQRAELLGAVRLPNNAFRANAGADVVSDIIFLQKREHPVDIEPDWVHLGMTPHGIAINSYFANHLDMILGELATESSPFGREETTVRPIPGADLGELLAEAVGKIRGTYTPAQDVVLGPMESRNTVPADPSVKNFSYTLYDGEIYFRENSVMRPVERKPDAAARIKGMLVLRGIVNELIDYQMEDYPEADIEAKQRELDAAYDAFAEQFGRINSRANAQAFEDDSSYYLLCSLENLDQNGRFMSKADMFTKRTIRPERKVDHVDTPIEALAVSIGEKGAVDLPYMADLLGEPGEYGKITDELSGVIFRDPLYGGGAEEGWQTADEYLSGNVREKLRVARVAEQTGAQYSVNVRALEKAQPKDLDASEIDVRLGATWIPPRVFEQFMYETFKTPFYLRRGIRISFSEYTAEWRISGKSQPSRYDVPAYVTYGTERANAYRILEETLNLKDLRIYDMVEDADGKKHRVLNKKETTLAQQRQQSIKDAFQDWIWQDPERRQMLVSRYNEIFNSERPREYDGSHITFGGMNPDISLRPHQLNAVAHVLYGGNTLLAHEVGAGKTFEMAASAMESKRLGLCQKSMFVVPNHLTLQWANEFMRLYPSANILVATRKDFETANRKKFCARIATGDYDAVIIGHSQFEKIPISAERQERMLNAQIEEIEDAIRELKFNRGENFTIKQMEKTKKTLQARLSRLMANERKDDVITFEQLGVDRLYVDESQAYKNLFLYTKMRNVAGLSTSEAQKSSDMFMKCQYMDEVTGGKGIVFATGTPVSNSMTEMYSLMRYLQYGKLKEKGLLHFDCWASTFGETTTAIELAPEGTGYRARTRFAKFFNLPELMTMFKEVADIKTSDQLDLPVPEANFETVVVKPSEIQKEMVASLSGRAAAVHSGKVDPSIDNMLKITSDGRKIGLDQRLMNPLLPDDPDSKLNACVRIVFGIWEKGSGEKQTQLIFCDMSTPKKDGTFNVYDDIKTKLTACGVPENEIAFIHDADTEVKKKELFAKVRAGEVRVLLGSTQKMGAGTNVQDRLIAVHHLDVGWRPSDMTQRNGRIIRQGNMNPEVQVYQYVTEGTFDAYLYQMLENKQRFISQIMTSKSPVRSCEDIDEQVLSYAEVKALCAGNPMIREKMDLDVDVARLRLLKADHQSRRYRLEDKLMKHYPAELEKQKGFIEGFRKDIETVNANPVPKDGFAGMRVGSRMYTEKLDAGNAILEACKVCTKSGEEPIGHYRGFDMSLSFEPFLQSFELVLRGSMTHRVGLGMDARGNITRIDNALSGITDKLERAQEKLEETRKQIEEAKIEAVKPFPQEKELRQKSARLAELDAALNMDVTGGMEEEVSVGGQAQEDGGQRSSVLEDLRTKTGQVTACRPVRYMEEAL